MKHRIEKVREKMEKRQLEAFLISSTANRFYVSGFTGTAGKILLTPTKNYFLTDSRYTSQASQEISGFEIKEEGPKNQLSLIGELLQKEEVAKLGFEAEHVSYVQHEKLDNQLEDRVELCPEKNLVAEIRFIKEDSEIKQIRQAVDLADRAFLHILDYLKPGIKEKEIALELEYFMKKQGGEDKAFDFIVASGPRSALPHGMATERKIQAGEFITMDFGIVINGYCSDMTRTVVLGEPDTKQCEVYETVLAAHERVIAEISPGMSCSRADALAREVIEEKGYGDYFGHNLGHGVGVEVHEGPRLSPKSERKLKPGMVVTNEPGIYIPEKFGVRIEDCLLITENGCEVLNNTKKEL